MPSKGDTGYSMPSNMDVKSGAQGAPGGDSTPSVAAGIALFAFLTLIGMHFSLRGVSV